MYTPEEERRLRAKWGNRLNEPDPVLPNQKLIKVYPSYIASLKEALSQHEFTEYYLWLHSYSHETRLPSDKSVKGNYVQLKMF